MLFFIFISFKETKWTFLEVETFYSSEKLVQYFFCLK